MRKVLFVLLLLGAHLNLTALVPLQAGDAPPPWWVGGMLLWPFDVGTRTLLPSGDLLNTLTPLLAITAAMCFLLAVAALVHRIVPGNWFPGLVAVGVIASIALQIIWLSAWAMFPLLVNIALLWIVFGMHSVAEPAHA
jgi:hypothetical protein